MTSMTGGAIHEDAFLRLRVDGDGGSMPGRSEGGSKPGQAIEMAAPCLTIVKADPSQNL